MKTIVTVGVDTPAYAKFEVDGLVSIDDIKKRAVEMAETVNFVPSWDKSNLRIVDVTRDHGDGRLEPVAANIELDGVEQAAPSLPQKQSATEAQPMTQADIAEEGVVESDNTLASVAKSLKHYQVSLHEEPGDKVTLIFECMAEDAEHAYEQAKDAYPGAKLLCAVVVGEAAAAQGMREVDRVAAEQERIAREQLGNYQFGDGLEFLDGQGTAFAVDCDVDRDDWACRVFVRDVDSAGDGELIALSFHAKFKPSTLQLLEVYALDMALGSDVGERG